MDNDYKCPVSSHHSLPHVKLEEVRDADPADWPWLEMGCYNIIEDTGSAVGIIEFWRVDRTLMRHTFHSCMDEADQELSQFALLVFNKDGSIRRTYAKESLRDQIYQNEGAGSFTFVSALVVDPLYRDQGFGSSALRVLRTMEECQVCGHKLPDRYKNLTSSTFREHVKFSPALDSSKVNHLLAPTHLPRARRGRESILATSGRGTDSGELGRHHFTQSDATKVPQVHPLIEFKARRTA
ncbi:hypothetical protein P7C70_g2286, partial [Phenoliferia sp. Uapishka_3]